MATTVSLATGGEPTQFYAKESPKRIKSLLIVAAANDNPAIELAYVGQPGDPIEHTPQPILIGVRYFISAAERRN